MLNKLSRKDIKLLNILAQTPEGKSALNEYIEQHEKAVKAYKAYRESVVAEVEVDKVVKPVETKRKFKAGDKVRILKEVKPDACSRLSVGDVSFVKGYKEDFLYWEGRNCSVNIRPVIVNDGSAKGKSLGSYFEESALELVEEKTPNELRAGIIEKAKEFVEENKHATVKIGHRCHSVSFGFAVNPEKRRVIALTKGLVDIGLQFEGVVECSPDDVYNEHIGKAIALGRALGKDMSEFENAVQPTLAVGQIVKFTPKYEGGEVKIQITKVDEEKLWFANEYGTEMCLDSGVSVVKIIDDTNAHYGGVE